MGAEPIVPHQPVELAVDASAHLTGTGSPGLGHKRSGPAIHTFDEFSDSIMENVNVWLNVLDTELNMVLWNDVAETMSGYSCEEVLGHNKIWEWLYPEPAYRQAITAKTSAMLEKNVTLEYFETRIRCKSGKTKIISWNSRSLLDERGDIYGAITFGYDITDRKLAEEALQKAHNDISALYHVASVASASLDLDTILERSLDCALATMKSGQGLVHLWDESQAMLCLAAQQGISPEVIAQVDAVRPGSGLVGRVFDQGQPLISPTVAGDPHVAQEFCDHASYAYAGVPMRAKGRVLGVFSVLGKAGRHFCADEVTLLVSIADQVGVAVDNARLYQQAEQLAVMEERERLAHDLHDSVTQSLYSLTLLAEAGRRLMRVGELERAEEYLARLGETAQGTLKEIRLLVYKLRPPTLDQEGLAGAIQQRLGAVERRAGVKAHLLANETIRLPAAVEEGLYRVAQEALNNALKHARANSVTVCLNATGEQVEMDILDNGIGFDPAAAVHRSGMGLVSMRERAKRLGGALQVISAPGEGTRVSVQIPMAPGWQETTGRS